MTHDFYKVTEIAHRLGVSRSRVYQLIAAGELPVVRVGNALRVPVMAWNEWVQQKAKEATSHAEAR